jgi:hypothetical protein
VRTLSNDHREIRLYYTFSHGSLGPQRARVVTMFSCSRVRQIIPGVFRRSRQARALLSILCRSPNRPAPSILRTCRISSYRWFLWLDVAEVHRIVSHLAKGGSSSSVGMLTSASYGRSGIDVSTRWVILAQC